MRYLYLFHRWAGVATGLLVLLWILSGVVMLYFPRPQWSAAERLQSFATFPAAMTLRDLDPARAWDRLHRSGAPEQASVRMQAGRAMFVFRQQERWFRVDERGRVYRSSDYTPAWALARVAEALGTEQADGEVRLVDLDQWTLAGNYNALRPFLKVAPDDVDGREFYVSLQSGDIVLDTSRDERLGNWFGSVVHWLYFTELRRHGGLWRQGVLWLSALALAMVLAGIVVGILRLRAGRRRYAARRISPYRERTRRLHHLAGLAAGIPLFCWLLSGWLSLSPLGLVRNSVPGAQEIEALRARRLDTATLAFRPAPVPIGRYREIEWARVADEPVVLLHADGITSHLRKASPGQIRAAFSAQDLAAPLASLLPGAALIGLARIDAPSDEYYPRTGRELRLPVLRAAFDDPRHTVYYVAPDTAEIVRKIDDPGRRYRWLFGALHSFDFPPLHLERLLRLGVIWLASALCALVAGLGVLLGWRRLTRP